MEDEGQKMKDVLRLGVGAGVGVGEICKTCKSACGLCKGANVEYESVEYGVSSIGDEH
jgi:hypothetical protein